MKNFGKISLISEFSNSKLGYMEMKIWEKKNDSFFKPFLNNQDKNENEDEKIWGTDVKF